MSVSDQIKKLSKDELARLKKKISDHNSLEIENYINTASLKNEPLAIIGLAFRFPGGANSLPEFWELLKNGDDVISKKDLPRLIDETGKQSSNSYWGGFIDDVDKFDTGFFGLSPREAELIDPQQRLLLETIWHAIEDAGHKIKDLSNSNTGVYAGACTYDYASLVNSLGINNAFSALGTSPSLLANRISFLMDLSGPSETIDTACSSSLVALHHAAEAIWNKECDQAIVGGVNLLLAPNLFNSFIDAGMLSPSGRCKTFDADADGYVRGEGVAALLIKPLSQAEKENDHIYGLINSTAVNHGGKANSLTSPSPKAQANLLVTAYEKAGVPFEQVAYIEAHGTGTALGDPIEIEGLQAAAKQLVKTQTGLPRCGLGSVKSNIGHLEAAAGLSGLIKILCCMKYDSLAPTVHYKKLNPHIELNEDYFYVVDKLQPWPSIIDASGNKSSRYAGVSSFGFGGMNAHAVLEKYTRKTIDHQCNDPAIILLSAKNKLRLDSQVSQLKDFLENNPNINLYDVAYTLQIGREAMPMRLASIVTSIDDLVSQLSAYGSGQTEELLLNDNNSVDNKFISLDGKAGKAYIDVAIKTKEHMSLAMLWVAGIDLNWMLIYEKGNLPSRISLPTYPFSREGYWLPDSGYSPQKNNPLHPLLHYQVTDSSQQKYHSKFTGKEFFFDDHFVFNEKLLPGVAYLEIARVAGQLTTKAPVTQIKDVVWVSPIVVTKNDKDVYTRLLPEDAGEIRYQVYSDNNGKMEEHSHGWLTTKPHRLKPEDYNIAELQQRLDKIRSREECYQILSSAGLCHGPSLQGIRKIWYNDLEGLSEIHLPEEPGHVLPVGILDSVLQTTTGTGGVVVADGEDTHLLLPFTVEEVNIYHKFPETVWAYVKKYNNNNASNRISRYDIFVMDSAGRVLLTFKNFVLIPFKLPKQNIQKKTDTYLYEYNWSNVSVLPTSKKNKAKTLTLLAGGSQDCANKLKNHLSGEVIALDATEEEKFFFQIITHLKNVFKEKSSYRVTVVYQNSDYLNYSFISGLLKSAAKEKPQVSVKTLGVDSLASNCIDKLITIITNEQTARDSEVCYKSQQRYAKRFKKVNPIDQSPVENNPIKDGGVYLITGGLGGLGLLFAKHINEKYKRTRLVLTGRRQLNADMKPAFEQLSKVYYEQCDVTNKAAVEKLIRNIKQDFGEINGIIHAAGADNVGTINKKSKEDVLSVLAPKITGIKNIDAATRNEPIDFLVAFSSITSLIGDYGLSDYAAANAYLDNFAIHRNSLRDKGLRKGKMLSINWGLWESGGMQANHDIKVYLKNQWGMLPFPTLEGLRIFEKLLTMSSSQYLSVYGNEDRISENLNCDDNQANERIAAVV